MLRVGRISYLNVEPFFHAFPWPLTEALPPRALGDAVAADRVDAGPLALADVIRLEDRLHVLPYGIAARERAGSVFLFSRRPMAALGSARIGVTAETATSVRLLRILLAWRDEVAPPVLVGPEEPADALLLIGDAALRARHGPREAWPHALCFDLGEQWTRWTGLPCVFAAWAVRSAVPRDRRDALSQALEESLRIGLGRLDEIARGRRDLGLTEHQVVQYLSAFTYRLGPDEEKAMAEFRRLLGLLPG